MATDRDKGPISDGAIRRTYDEANKCNRLHDRFDHGLVTLCYHDLNAFARALLAREGERAARLIHGNRADGCETTSHTRLALAIRRLFGVGGKRGD